MVKISVIIPVYNVEKYLSQCLDSVINQTYKNLEIICVEDCSTDNSPQILQEYAQKDARIKILYNEKNSKLGPTRNNGVKVATGDYIHFLDSDDYMEPDAYETVVNCIKENSSVDIIHFYWNIINELGEKCSNNIPDYDDIWGKKIDINIEKDQEFLKLWGINAWCKIYKKTFLDEYNLKFNNYPCLEDIEWSFTLLKNLKEIYFMNKSLVNYRVDRTECLTLKSFQYWEYRVKSIINAYKLFENSSIQLKRKIFTWEFKFLYNSLWRSYELNYIDFKTLKNVAKEINQIIKNDFSHCNWYIYYLDLINDPEWLVKFKYFARGFTKNYIPNFYNLLLQFRKKLRLLRGNV